MMINKIPFVAIAILSTFILWQTKSVHAITISCKKENAHLIADKLKAYMKANSTANAEESLKRAISENKDRVLEGFRGLVGDHALTAKAICTNVSLTLIKIAQIAMNKRVGELDLLNDQPRKTLGALSVVRYLMQDFKQIDDSLQGRRNAAPLRTKVNAVKTALIKQLQALRDRHADKIVKPITHKNKRAKTIFRVAAYSPEEYGYRIYEFYNTNGHIKMGEKLLRFSRKLEGNSLGRAKLFVPSSHFRIFKERFENSQGVTIGKSAGRNYQLNFEALGPIRFSIEKRQQADQIAEGVVEFFRLFSNEEYTSHERQESFEKVEKKKRKSKPLFGSYDLRYNKQKEDTPEFMERVEESNNTIKNKPTSENERYCYKYKDKAFIYKSKNPEISNVLTVTKKGIPIWLIKKSKIVMKVPKEDNYYDNDHPIAEWAEVVIDKQGKKLTGWIPWKKVKGGKVFDRFKKC